MITKIHNDITLCVMGEGTLYSGVVKDTEGNPAGIVFTKSPTSMAEGVLFQISDIQGFAGFMAPVAALMEAWHQAGRTTGTSEEEAQFLNEIQGLRATLAPHMPVAKEIEAGVATVKAVKNDDLHISEIEGKIRERMAYLENNSERLSELKLLLNWILCKEYY